MGIGRRFLERFSEASNIVEEAIGASFHFLHAPCGVYVVCCNKLFALNAMCHAVCEV